MGRTLSLDVPDEVYHALKRQADQTGQSLESVALQLLAGAAHRHEDDPLEQFIGAFSGHGSDWADQHDAYLGKSVRERMR